MKFWNTLSPIARTLIIIAIIVLVFMIIYYIRKGLKKSQLNQDFNKDYQTLTEASNQKPTYLSSNYSEFADKIYEAGCSGLFCYGTDEQAMYDVFEKMQNDLDVLLLIKAFGLREPRGSICIPIPGTGSCDYPIGQWLQTELSADEFKEINNILTRKGIKFQF